MAVITDLNWSVFNLSCVAIGLTTSLEIDNNDYQAEPESFTITLENQGVIETLTRLLQAARIAQEQINDGQEFEDRLAAFPVEEVGIAKEGFVPVTRAVIGYHELASATNIVGNVSEQPTNQSSSI